MNPLARLLILLGVLLVIVGLVWQWGGRWIPWGRLPGDVVYERDSVRIYIPWVTCLLFSGVLSLLLWLWRGWMR